MKRDSDFFLILIMAIAMLLLLGCTRSNYASLQSTLVDSISSSSEKQYQRVERLISDYSRSNVATKETYIKDSVVMVINEAGDMLSREVIRITDTSTNQQEIISAVQVKVDSIMSEQIGKIYALLESEIQVPIPVERKLTTWEKIKQDYFGYLLVTLLIMLLRILRKPLSKLVKRNVLFSIY